MNCIYYTTNISYWIFFSFGSKVYNVCVRAPSLDNINGWLNGWMDCWLFGDCCWCDWLQADWVFRILFYSSPRPMFLFILFFFCVLAFFPIYPLFSGCNNFFSGRFYGCFFLIFWILIFVVVLNSKNRYRMVVSSCVCVCSCRMIKMCNEFEKILETTTTKM